MTDVESTIYNDDGRVEREVVITTDEKEFVVIDTDGRENLGVYERVPGMDEGPHKRLI